MVASPSHSSSTYKDSGNVEADEWEEADSCLSTAIAVDEEVVKWNVVDRDEESGTTACHTHVQKYKLWIAEEFAWKQPICLVSQNRVVLRHTKGDGKNAEDHDQGDDTAIVPMPDGPSEGKCHCERDVQASCENGTEPVEAF